MKVRVSLTVEIDPERWTLLYGIEGSAAIRADVQGYCEETVRTQLIHAGAVDE